MMTKAEFHALDAIADALTSQHNQSHPCRKSVETAMAAVHVERATANRRKLPPAGQHMTDREVSNVLHGRDYDDNGEFTASSMGAATDAREGVGARTFGAEYASPRFILNAEQARASNAARPCAYCGATEGEEHKTTCGLRHLTPRSTSNLSDEIKREVQPISGARAWPSELCAAVRNHSPGGVTQDCDWPHCGCLSDAGRITGHMMAREAAEVSSFVAHATSDQSNRPTLRDALAIGAVMAVVTVAAVLWTFHVKQPKGVDPMPAADPYECFGAGRYDAMRDGRTCPDKPFKCTASQYEAGECEPQTEGKPVVRP